MATNRIAPAPAQAPATQNAPAQPATPPQAAAAATPAPQDDHRNPLTLSASQELRRSLIQSERYVDHYYNDPAGHCTYGIGTLVHRGNCTPAELATPLTRADIERSFENSIGDAERSIRRNVMRPLTQAQFDALVSLTYNAGAGGAQPLYHAINHLGPEDAARSILTTAIHTHGHVSRGILNRRQRELAIYQGRPVPR